jgi:hypothetical protein
MKQILILVFAVVPFFPRHANSQVSDSAVAGCYVIEHVILPNAILATKTPDSIRQQIPVRLDLVRHLNTGQIERLLWNIYVPRLPRLELGHPFGERLGTWELNRDSIIVRWASLFDLSEFRFPADLNSPGRSLLQSDVETPRVGRVAARRIPCEETCRNIHGVCVPGLPGELR